MALSRFDRNELVLPLFDGLFEAPLWHTFLVRLAVRTGADRVHLALDAPGGPPLDRWAPGPRTATSSHLAGKDRRALATLPLARMRPLRVYTLDELRDFDDVAARAGQDAALSEAGIGDARLMRVSQGSYAARLVLLADRPRFGGADSALLSELAPALETALSNLAAIDTLRLRADAAEGTLARLGIGQAVLDRNGHALAADDRWEERLAGRSLPTADVAAMDGEPRTVRIGDDPGYLVLLRPVDDRLPGERRAHGVVVAALRDPQRPWPPHAERILAAELELSPREAALSLMLAQGRSLTEAGRALFLTEETARNYSKRIYAKTGARGQADLVRRVLGSLASLA